MGVRSNTLAEKYDVVIDRIKASGKNAYVLHEANLRLLFYSIEELQTYLEEVY